MSSDEWDRLQRLFFELVSVPDLERERLLSAVRVDHADIHARLVKLLANATTSDGFLDGGVFALVDASKTGGLEPEAPFAGSERFRVIRKLGAGGMGTVYEARDNLLEALVALKTLHYATPAAITLFKHEFRGLANLHHRNLVTLYELFADGERWFYTMELVHGVDALQYAERGEAHGDPATRSERRHNRVRALFAQLLAGVTALHAAGKLHCDIKPSNVLVADAGRVVLLDFGLLADFDSRRRRSMPLAGTIAYMSPEQVRGESLTPASDWYAVGVMLYQCLTGALPPAAAIRILQPDVAIPAPYSLAPIPADLSDLCLRLLEWEPQRRPDPTEILERLSGPATAIVRAPVHELGTDWDLVGRGMELSILQRAWEDTAAGHTVSVCVEGPSGIGKTALVEHFLLRLSVHPQVAILRGRCRERESVPFNAFDSLMDDLSEYLRARTKETLADLLPPEVNAVCQMFPVLEWLSRFESPVEKALDQGRQRRAASAALRELFTRIARGVRLVLFIDDLQWGDIDSATMLVELLREPNASALLVIAAYRDEHSARSACLQRLWPDRPDAQLPAPVRVLVKALDQSAARLLATSLLQAGGMPNGGALWPETIARESTGNPFHIRELAAFACDDESSRGVTLVPSGLTLTSVIQSRLDRLPAQARRLLEIIAVAGRPIRSVDALGASALDADSLTWMTLLRSHRFVRGVVAGTEREQLETFHDRLRETVLATIDVERRKGCHLSLAVCLERSGVAESELLATHFMAAGEGTQAAPHYVSAAHKAASALAFNNAADLYRRALDVAEHRLSERRALTRDMAEALANAGRAFEAAAAFQEAADEQSHEGLLWLSRAGYHYAASGHRGGEGGICECHRQTSLGLVAARTVRGADPDLGSDVASVAWLPLSAARSPGVRGRSGQS